MAVKKHGNFGASCPQDSQIERQIRLVVRGKSTILILQLSGSTTVIVKKAVIILLLIFGQQFGHSQSFFGLNTSNYAGINGVDLQPASLADNRYKLDILLLGTTLEFNNSYIGFSPAMFKNIGDSVGGAFRDPDFQSKYLTEFLNGKPKSIFFNNEIQLPSVSTTLSDKAGLGINWKVRTMLNIDNFGEELAQLVYAGLEFPTLWDQDISNENLSIQVMTWVEYGLSYGRVVSEANDYSFKVGGRVKLLQGLLSGYMFAEDFRYNFSDDDTLNILQTDVEYGHSNNFEWNGGTPQYKFIANPTVGGDIGVTYEFRPNRATYTYDMDGQTGLLRNDKNKYKFKIGASILDIGRIKFTKGGQSGNFHADISDWYIQDETPGGVADFDSLVNSRFLLTSSAGESYKMNLPTAFSLQFDYNIGKGFFVNATTFWALPMTKDRNKVHQFTNYNLTPRWESKFLGLSLPMAYSGTVGFRPGAMVRLGPLIIGTADLRPLLGVGTAIRGIDIYAALKVSIPHGKPRDKDLDKVSDPLDDCKEIAGTWELRGCPDTDNDGITDNIDDCPTVAGSPEYNGCPDSDGDKIIDKKDDCPEVAGLAEFRGCPDTDGDGIKDSEDACPQVPGLIELKGCPKVTVDTDQDGIMDEDDKCPQEYGPASNDGCPVVLHLLDENGNVVATVVKDKNGEFIFKNLSLNKTHVFKLVGEDPSLLMTLPILIEVDGKLKKISADNIEDGMFEYKYIAPSEVKLNLVDENGVIIQNVVKDKNGEFLFYDLPLDKTLMFTVEGTDPSDLSKLTIVVVNDGVRTVITADKEGGYFIYKKLKADPAPIEVITVPDPEPVLTVEEKIIVEEAFNNLEFTFNEAVIVSTSFKSLENLANLLLANPSWKLKLEGHTDDVAGPYPEYNMDLSRRRAMSTKNYFLMRGLDWDKIIVEYYGETKPIASNKTEAGRQKNRRVEMIILK